MSEFPSLPLFTDAFIADTGHLSAHETGAYLILLMVAWRMPDCRLPDDDAKLARWARVDARRWPATKAKVMAFWTLEDGLWSQKRLLSERDKVRLRASVARTNGSKGGRPPAPQAPTSDAEMLHDNASIVLHSDDTKSLKSLDHENPTGSPWDTQKKAPISISISKRSEEVPSEDFSREKPSDGGATILPFQTPGDQDLGPSRSDEDQFWNLAGALSGKGITRSRAGQLAKLCDGDFTAALVQLRAVARAKEPSSYLGAVIRGLREERGETLQRVNARAGPQEPEFVSDFRRGGYPVEKLDGERWRCGGDIFDKRGRVVGW